MKKPNTLKEYYKYYLTLHQNRACRRLHVMGQVATIGLLLYTVYSQSWLLLLLAPFIVYPFAWVGHVFLEKNKPAAWSNPLWAKASDWMMLRDWILGRIER